MNYQHLHYKFPIQPFQRCHVIEDRSVPRGMRFRHARQPGEKPDPKVNFGMEELSARLEHAGVDYLRIALGNDGWSFALAEVILRCGMEGEGPNYEKWYPAISWVRDDGFYAVCLHEQMPYRDTCRLFGFDIPAGKPSVPKRIKRDVARGRTSLFGDHRAIWLDINRASACRYR